MMFCGRNVWIDGVAGVLWIIDGAGEIDKQAMGNYQGDLKVVINFENYFRFLKTER